MCDDKDKKETKQKTLSETNGDKHNLIPDSEDWMELAKDDMEDFIESQGIHIRQ